MNFLDRIYFDNTLNAWLIVAAIILFVLLFKKFFSRYLVSLCYKLANKILKNVEKRNFIDLVAEPIEWFVVITVSVFSIDKLNFPSQLHFKIYGHTAEDIITRIGPGIMIVTFIWLLLRLIDFSAIILEQKANQTEDTRDNQLVVFFRDFFKVLVSIIGVLWIIKACFYQPIGNVLTGLSIVGAALALAAKESLENLIASFIIFFDKPFFTGDVVKVNNITGLVEQVGLRSTRIRTVDKTLVTVPNKQMVDSMVDNWSLRTERRAEIKLDLPPQTTVDDIQNFTNAIKQLLAKRTGVIESSQVFVKDISKNGIQVSIEFFTAHSELAAFDALKEELLMEIKKVMEDKSILLINSNNTLAI